jgi:hypothetical protein
MGRSDGKENESENLVTFEFVVYSGEKKKLPERSECKYHIWAKGFLRFFIRKKSRSLGKDFSSPGNDTTSVMAERQMKELCISARIITNLNLFSLFICTFSRSPRSFSMQGMRDRKSAKTEFSSH